MQLLNLLKSHQTIMVYCQHGFTLTIQMGVRDLVAMPYTYQNRFLTTNLKVLPVILFSGVWKLQE